MSKKVRVVMKKEKKTHDYDRDCIPDDQHLQNHVDNIWNMMVQENMTAAKEVKPADKPTGE